MSMSVKPKATLRFFIVSILFYVLLDFRTLHYEVTILLVPDSYIQKYHASINVGKKSQKPTYFIRKTMLKLSLWWNKRK